MSRETLLAQTLVQLADTLVDDFDIVELLTLLTDRCVEILDVSAAGLMLVAAEGDLRVVASSSEEMRLVELFEIQSSEGPCPDCYHSGEAVLNEGLTGATTRWPRFAPVAVEAGFRSVSAVPMRLRGLVIGALNLFGDGGSVLDAADASAAGSLADVATIAILQSRAAFEAHSVIDQLNDALNDRVTIEQAKGMLAERTGLSLGQAFTRLRKHARDHNLRLLQVSHAVIDGTLTFPAPPPPPSRTTR
jgi:GAF domain-containing protein